MPSASVYLPWKHKRAQGECAAQVFEKALDQDPLDLKDPEGVQIRKVIAAGIGELRNPSPRRDLILKALEKALEVLHLLNLPPLSIRRQFLLQALRRCINGGHLVNVISDSALEDIVARTRFFDACPEGEADSDLHHAFQALWKAEAYEAAYKHVGSTWPLQWTALLEDVIIVTSGPNVTTTLTGIINRNVQ